MTAAKVVEERFDLVFFVRKRIVIQAIVVQVGIFSFPKRKVHLVYETLLC